MQASKPITAALFFALASWHATPASGQAEMVALVGVNQCDQRLSVLVSAVPENGRRQTFGWFTLPPNSDQSLFAGNGDMLMHNSTMPFFVFASNADESLTWSEPDLRVVWQNRSYEMQRRDLLTVEGTGPFNLRAFVLAC